MDRREPTLLPEWNALHRESSLVSQLIGSGATALGRASYGSGFGEYYTAFFGLSVGIERLAKLIVVADYIMENAGSLPKQSIIRKHGHNLDSLIKKVDGIASSRGIVVPHIGPTHPICTAIIECLDSFANASIGRYANFESIGNPNFNQANEPVNKWWAEVVEPILTTHYRGKSAEFATKRRALLMDAVAGKSIFVRFSAETGSRIINVAEAFERTGQTKWAQKYGRYYSLSVVRWLSYIFEKLTYHTGYTPGYEVLFGHHEFFDGFVVDNTYLLNRKIWPLR